FWVMHEGSSQFSLIGQSVEDDACFPGFPSGTIDTCSYFPNVATVNIADDQWFCVETRMKMNTPGLFDGILELYVNGTRTLNYTNRRFRGPNVDNGFGNSSLSTFSNVRFFMQHGIGHMYYDDVAIGNARIGCGGITTPPAPADPFNLTVTQL